MRDVSLSGAFLETTLPLPLFSQIAIAVRRDDGSTHLMEFTATVVRSDLGGVGIEWCEPVSGFRAVSRAAKFDWLTLQCRVEGTLKCVDGQSRFTLFATHATLSVPAGADAAKARALLERAEHGCLIANSLRGTRTLDTEVVEDAPGSPRHGKEHPRH